VPGIRNTSRVVGCRGSNQYGCLLEARSRSSHRGCFTSKTQTRYSISLYSVSFIFTDIAL
ncbi:hypothetical protein B0T20DRAFT_355960, partial [Sordaria brevicollis]